MFNPSSKMERWQHNYKTKKVTWTDSLGKESMNQRRSQEIQGNYGQAADIHKSGSRI